MNSIDTSLFDIFKTGPGPSSSHTIGPMLAAAAFCQAAAALPEAILNTAERLEVHLYGSLSSTGKGHGTDGAVIAGLLGHTPEHCDTGMLKGFSTRPASQYSVKLGRQTVSLSPTDIVFEQDNQSPFANTMVFRLNSADDRELLSQTYYSVGGGFIRRAGEAEPVRPPPPYPYANFRQFKHLVERTGLAPTELLLRNEQVLSGLTGPEIEQRLDALLETMDRAVVRGLHTTGLLPGKIGLERKAMEVFRRAVQSDNPAEQQLLTIDAAALAAAEENADGQIIVTAPTSGSSGVLPGLLYWLRHQQHIEPQRLRDGMLIAGLIAFVARHNASISGAEVGCQGEIGVASAMAAAMLAQIYGHPLAVIENAAESALEHHLGMTCDPIGGYVQIPCIERNAVSAVTAYNAYLLAAYGSPDKHKLSFDAVIETMLETGQDMSARYKETAAGGLAVCGGCCR